MGGGSGSGDQVTIEELRQRTVPASVSMVVMVAQVIGLLADGKYAWSSATQSTLGVFNAANIDVNLFASECSLSTFHAKYAVSVLLPLLVVAVVFVALVALRMAAKAGVSVFGLGALASTQIKTLMDAVLFSVAPLLYIPMARSTFVLFDCSRLPNGDIVLDVDPGVPCLDGDWWSVAPVGVLGLATYVFGIPMYFLWCLVKRRHELLMVRTFARYGSLYKLFRVPYFWGGVADLGKRLAIVIAAVFVSEHQLVQIGLLLAVFLTALVVVNRLRPYYFPLYNTLDFRLTLILIVLLLLGGASHAERGTAGSSDTAILVGVILVLVVLAGVAIHAVAIDILQIMRMRKLEYSTESDRRAQMAAYLEKERVDLDPEVAAEVTEWVRRLVEHPGKPRGGADTFSVADMD